MADRPNRNENLVFDPGNQFADNFATPYCVIPGYWRRFLFHVLKPRDVAVYLYIATLCDRNAIAFPSLDQIQEDLGISSPTTIMTSLGRLEDLGFLLRSRAHFGKRSTKVQRNVYQRPSPHYTLLTLLQKGLIDGDLFATGVPRGENSASSDRAVEMGLRHLLGVNYEEFNASAPGERGTVLNGKLDAELNQRKAESALIRDLAHERFGKELLRDLARAQTNLLRAAASINNSAPGQPDREHGTMDDLIESVALVRERLETAIAARDITRLKKWAKFFASRYASIDEDFTEMLRSRKSRDRQAEGALQTALQNYRHAAHPLLKRIDELPDAAKVAAPF